MSANRKKKKNKPVIPVLALALAVVLACFIVIHIMSAPVDKKDTEHILVKIEEGYTAPDIANALDDAGVIKSKSMFKIKSKLSGSASRFKTGTYIFTKAMSLDKIMGMIANGESAGKVFIVQDGTTIHKIAKMLEEKNVCSAKDFYNEVENGDFDYGFMKYLPSGPTRLEGFLYPDTYEIPLDGTAHDVVDEMLKGFDRKMKEEGIYKLAEEKDAKDFYTYIIEASIIQKEAAGDSDMAKVASVIDNRIEADMPLQMDSTVAYVHQEDKIRATFKDIQVDSAFNTYKIKGLPPGPICSPAISAIKAALEPADTDYLYFVVSPELDGTCVFSKTYKEFLKDKEEFDKAYEKYIKEHPDER
jgi:UPF0755 protein